MPDREKVINGLNGARRYLEDKEWSDRGASPHIDAINDALELLKAQRETIDELISADKALKQEAVEPITQSFYNSDEWFYVCGSCKKGVIGRGDKFCRWCGKAVKWE